MDLSIPLMGMQAASAAFDSAANATARGSMTSTAPNSAVPAGDSVDLSTSFVNLMSAKLDFMANVKTAAVEDQINQSTFSILG